MLFNYIERSSFPQNTPWTSMDERWDWNPGKPIVHSTRRGAEAEAKTLHLPVQCTTRRDS